MVREIVRDTMFLSRKSEDASEDDLYIADDLVDTIHANSERCVGIAANMIGKLKRIIAVQIGMFYLPMINPVIVKHSSKVYETAEGCLCHKGERKAKRYESIEVEFLNRNFEKQRQKFEGYTAQIIQHEIDHCNGIII